MHQVRFTPVHPLDTAIRLTNLEVEILSLLKDKNPRTTRYILNELKQKRNWFGRLTLTLNSVHNACYSLWNNHKIIATYNNSISFPKDQQAWVYWYKG